MAYPDRIATLHPTAPTRTINMTIGATLPVLTDVQETGLNNVEFRGGQANGQSEEPVLHSKFIQGANAGLQFLGLKSGAFAEWRYGTPAANTSFSGKGTHVSNGKAFTTQTVVETTTKIYTFNYKVDTYTSFTGGVQTGVYAAATPFDLTFVTDIGTNGGIRVFVNDPASTVANPSIYAIGSFYSRAWPRGTEVGMSNIYFGAFKMSHTGTVTLAGTVAYGDDSVGLDHVCRSGSTFYGFGAIADAATGVDYYGHCRFTLGVFNDVFASTTWDFNNYKAKIDDAWIQTNIFDPGFGMQMTSVKEGFVFEYLDATATKKIILVQKDWSTYQFIEFVGVEANATALIASYMAKDFSAGDSFFHPQIATDPDGVWYLAHGLMSAPKYAYSTSEIGGGVVASTDTTKRIRVWGFSLDGHDFYVLRVGPSETLVYDLTTDKWSSWASPAAANLRAHVGQNWVGMASTTFAKGLGTDVVAGDDTTGVLWVLDPASGLDDNVATGSTAFNRTVTGGLLISGRDVIPCGAVTLDLAVGSPVITGYSLRLEISDDLAKTWVDCGSVAVITGANEAVVEWRGLGTISAPGRVFRVTDTGATTRIGALNLR